MARRRQNILEILVEVTSKLPWWAGVALAIAAYAWLHDVAGTEVTIIARPGQMGQSAILAALKSLATVGQYVLPFAFLVGAGLSAYGRYKRRALHEQVAASPERGCSMT